MAIYHIMHELQGNGFTLLLLL